MGQALALAGGVAMAGDVEDACAVAEDDGVGTVPQELEGVGAGAERRLGQGGVESEGEGGEIGGRGGWDGHGGAV